MDVNSLEKMVMQMFAERDRRAEQIQTWMEETSKSVEQLKTQRGHLVTRDELTKAMDRLEGVTNKLDEQIMRTDKTLAEIHGRYSMAVLMIGLILTGVTIVVDVFFKK